ncbi:MAG TPA: sodium:solute symporter [Terriglobia bacterium]|nr:sodium:solute symporter [Terriglobia bacterium]
MNWTATIVFVLLFVFVTYLGFAAARWRQGDLNHLHEWGLGGRRFGTIVTWFLLGGDLYTAYTFVAVPALVYGAGAVGFFAIPYTILIYPILFLVFPRLWTVAHRKGYVTPADFVRGRYGNRWLALAIALTGVIATMPYIALQLVGMEVVIGALGFHAEGLIGDLPLIIAFIILAAFTYTSGLRAPAMIAVVKDVLIYIAVIAAVVVVPAKLGGFSAIFAKIDAAKTILPVPADGTTIPFSGYATLALGSALALFLYPHSMTAILSSSDGRVIRRNASILPAYSLVLGLLALLGFMAVAAGVGQSPDFADGFKQYGANFAVPALFLAMFPSWFVGVAFAAIAIGALVPAAIMSIACANLYTRNIYREFINPNCSHIQESSQAKMMSLLVKVGALFFVVYLPQQYAIQMQLLGGIWIIQTLPAIMLGLYTRWFNSWALLIGWAVSMVAGTWMEASLGFKGAVFPLHIFGYSFPCYIALAAVALNIVVSGILTVILQYGASDRHIDDTKAADYV